MQYEFGPHRVLLTDHGTLIAKVMLRTEGGVTSIEHTYVAEAYRGRGIGGKIVQKTLDYIKENGNLVKPVCPFATAWLEAHPEYADMLAQP